MTPEEIKAKEIIEKYIPLTKDWHDHDGWVTNKIAAKQCALIEVDGIIAELNLLRKPEYTTFIDWEQLKTQEAADTWDGYERIAFYESVKEHLLKQ